jgi:hypothetical protein
MMKTGRIRKLTPMVWMASDPELVKRLWQMEDLDPEDPWA